MKIVQVIPSFSRFSGGLFISISNLVKNSQAQGINVIVCGPDEHETSEDLATWDGAQVRKYRRVGPKTFGYMPRLLAGLDAIEPDLIHAHGLWTSVSLMTSLWGGRCKKPRVLSIHGMLEPWALRQSNVKKQIARWLYQDRVIQGMTCVRATSLMEVKNIRRLGFTNPVALVPNGVDAPPRPPVDLRPRERGVRRALFLSRLHPKKGILELIEAWRRLRPSNWLLTIVGPDEAGYQALVEAAIKDAGMEHTITLPGPSWGDKRFMHYWQSDLFILPSYSENFGLVVPEALACEVPVITTKGLPWREIEEHDCGWWIEIGIEPLVEALEAATSASDEQRAAMGKRGRKLIEERYSWSGIAAKMNGVYDWVLGKAGRPDFIES